MNACFLLDVNSGTSFKDFSNGVHHRAVAFLCVDVGSVSVAYFAGFHAYGWWVVCLWGEVHACVNTQGHREGSF